eukprot:NODE_1789_length_1062_cov_311.607746.p1 GENE.NODE_1789_length_1062_cov_311.607746~~NODE_1789_length_1062_cov_311.607746.p1  ORF type:complete len:231 (+),score=56.46 NODE_1789_length_1062_cov_311.607746:3-695(+)
MGAPARVTKGVTVPPELCVIEGKATFEAPAVTQHCRLMGVPPLRGVIFDLQGALVLPEQMDPQCAPECAGVPAGEPAEEVRALTVTKVQPGALECLEYLRDAGVPRALVTKCSREAVDAFLKHAKLPQDLFSPIITCAGNGETVPILLCCKAWGVEASSLLFIGGTVADMDCARKVGCPTVAVRPNSLHPAMRPGAAWLDATAEAAVADAPFAACADFRVSSLASLHRFC